MRTRYKISFVLVGVVAVFVAYVSLTVNLVAGASLLVVTPFLFCMIPCGGAVGASVIMWFTHQSKMKNNSKEHTERKLNGCLVDKQNQ